MSFQTRKNNIPIKAVEKKRKRIFLKFSTSQLSPIIKIERRKKKKEIAYQVIM